MISPFYVDFGNNLNNDLALNKLAFRVFGSVDEDEPI